MATLNSLQFQFSRNLSKLINFANSQGYEVAIGEVLRTEYQQKEYLRLGYSKTLNSYHLKKLAVDLYFFKNAKLISNTSEMFPFALHWESLHANNVAGFYWGWDQNHFEMRENALGSHQVRK